MNDMPEQPQPTRRRKRTGRILFVPVFLLIAAATVVGGALVMLHRAYTDTGPLAQNTTVVIPAGASGQQIAAGLADAGVVADARLMRVAIRLFAPKRPLRAGEYAFPAGVTLKEAVAKLQDGDIVVRRVTIAEGLTTRQAMAALSLADGLTGPVPEPGEVGEGTLLPETYHYSLGDSRSAMVARMQTAMKETLVRMWERRRKGLPISSPYEALILASIVERETAVAEERPRVAAVFINRLEKGMKLQSDPTVAYGLSTDEGEFEGRLLYKHLETDHPYNTYVHEGLPPGPIANPGAQSLAAVLDPADSDDLYFVADGTGGHAFARTLEEHNRNVAKWRRIQRERARSSE